MNEQGISKWKEPEEIQLTKERDLRKTYPQECVVYGRSESSSRIGR